MDTIETEKPKECKILPCDGPRSKLRPLNDPFCIEQTSDSEENNFASDCDGFLKSTTKNIKTSKKVNSPYLFDRDDMINKTLENFYKTGIMPVVKTLKRELYCHHARFVELMIKHSFNKDIKTSRELFNCLPNLYTTMIVSQKDLVIGLDKIIQNIDEIELDYPFAALKTLHLIRFLINTGVLYETYIKMLPHVFYEYVIRNYHHLKESADRYNILPQHIQELVAYSASYNENIKEYLKEVIIYREICQEVIDVLYKSKDSEKILQFFDGATESYLVHEFLLLYIQRSIFRSLNYVLKVSETLEELWFKIPRSFMEMAFIRLLGGIPKNFSESIEAQELLCIFLARSIVDGLITSSFIRRVNRVQIGGKLGVELISKTIKWVKFNKNHHRFKKEGSTMVLNFPFETILNRRVRILSLIVNFLRTGEGLQFPKKLEEIDKLNLEIIFTLKTLVTRFLARENALVYKMAQIFALLANNGQIGKSIVRIVINDISKVIHLVEGYGVHSEKNLQKLKFELRDEGLY